MNKDELVNVVGGAAQISASMLNALSRGVTTLYEVGRALGTAIKMLLSGSKC